MAFRDIYNQRLKKDSIANNGNRNLLFYQTNYMKGFSRKEHTMYTSTIITEHFIETILDGLDQSDRMIRLEIQKFSTVHQMFLEEQINEDDILHKIESNEAINAIIQLHRAKIELEAAKRWVEHSEKKLEIAEKQMGLAINEYEDIPNENWNIDIHRMLLMKRKLDQDILETYEFIKAMANGAPEISLEAIRNGKFPDSLDAVEKSEVTRKLLADLADFLIETGSKGHSLVTDTCNSVKTASEIVADESMPIPLRAVAVLTLEIRRYEKA